MSHSHVHVYTVDTNEAHLSPLSASQTCPNVPEGPEERAVGDLAGVVLDLALFLRQRLGTDALGLVAAVRLGGLGACRGRRLLPAVLLPPLGRDLQHTIREGHLDVLLPAPGQVGVDQVALLRL